MKYNKNNKGTKNEKDKHGVENSGDQGVASNSGEEGIAMAVGREGKARGSKGSWIVASEWKKKMVSGIGRTYGRKLLMVKRLRPIRFISLKMESLSKPMIRSLEPK